MKKLIKILAAVVIMLAVCWQGSMRVSAAPFTCTSNFYQVIAGQLKLLNPLTGAYSNIGSNAGFSYNAMGYNVLDDYMYAIATDGPNPGDLYRVSDDGTLTDLGFPTGMAVATYANGSMDSSGNLYVLRNGTTIYKVDVNAVTATALTITGDPISVGFDSVIINNKFYTLQGSTLSVVDLDTLVNTTATVTGPSGWLTGGNAFGAAWTDQVDELFFSHNADGSIFEILDYDTTSPTAIFKVAGAPTGDNDGASCKLAAQSPFDPPEAVDDSYSGPANEDITGTVITNDMGNTITVTTHTAPSHGTLSLNPDGTFVYTPNDGFSGTDTFTYTITDYLGRTATATVTLIVSATAPNTGLLQQNMLVTYISLTIGTGILLLSALYRRRSNVKTP